MCSISLRIRQLNEDMFSRSRNEYMLYVANNNYTLYRLYILFERIEYLLLSQKVMHLMIRLLHTDELASNKIMHILSYLNTLMIHPKLIVLLKVLWMFDIQIFVWVFVSYRNALNIKNSFMKVKIIFKN